MRERKPSDNMKYAGKLVEQYDARKGCLRKSILPFRSDRSAVMDEIARAVAEHDENKLKKILEDELTGKKWEGKQTSETTRAVLKLGLIILGSEKLFAMAGAHRIAVEPSQNERLLKAAFSIVSANILDDKTLDNLLKSDKNILSARDQVRVGNTLLQDAIANNCCDSAIVLIKKMTVDNFSEIDYFAVPDRAHLTEPYLKKNVLHLAIAKGREQYAKYYGWHSNRCSF